MNVSRDSIPNNVHLTQDRKLQKALESWQPDFLNWWTTVGPEGFNQDHIYLRTAVSVEPDGWAHFDYVKMPEYRWGVFLTPTPDGRKIPFGDSLGEDVWDHVPGEFRKELRRIIVTQADTEPASVEQQRLLGRTAPSLYDLRNLFQVNVEEGRHLWAMVYLLHRYFGKDGRDEADDLLVRCSGNPDTPRMLDAFNKPVEDWLAFFAFATFMDRDGKYQLGALAESGFDPLSRTTRFMLTEEAHHLFVGEAGLGRIVQRTAELMKQDPNEEVERLGGIPLDIIQKYINEWLSASMDLFGGENSSNSANYFASGLKGRWNEEKDPNITDHVALSGSYQFQVPQEDGSVEDYDIPLRRAMNVILRDSYMTDCHKVLERWNRVLENAGLPDRLTLPSQRFNRNIGLYSGLPFDPEGNRLHRDEWNRRRNEFLPDESDYEHVESLMVPEIEPGKFAGWITPPQKGINKLPPDHRYVKRAKKDADDKEA